MRVSGPSARSRRGGRIVGRITGEQQVAAQAFTELLKFGALQGDALAVGGERIDIAVDGREGLRMAATLARRAA
ncbi:MAG: hypothetical protein WDO56_08845 [Gammaproteobacteria bacterium]